MIDYTREELVELLKKNPDRFNEWKAEQGDEEINLSEMDFSGLTLNEIDFSNINLNSSSFADCSLSLINFTNTDLTSVDFTRSHIIECDFTESLMTGTDCSYSVVSYCNFTDTDLAGCIFSEADLSNSDFSSSVNLHASRFDEDTVWLSLDQMAELFQRDKSTISRHIKNIFTEGELRLEATVAKFTTVQMEGKR